MINKIHTKVKSKSLLSYNNRLQIFKSFKHDLDRITIKNEIMIINYEIYRKFKMLIVFFFNPTCFRPDYGAICTPFKFDFHF